MCIRDSIHAQQADDAVRQGAQAGQRSKGEPAAGNAASSRVVEQGGQRTVHHRQRQWRAGAAAQHVGVQFVDRCVHHAQLVDQVIAGACEAAERIGQRLSLIHI